MAIIKLVVDKLGSSEDPLRQLFRTSTWPQETIYFSHGDSLGTSDEKVTSTFLAGHCGMDGLHGNHLRTSVVPSAASPP